MYWVLTLLLFAFTTTNLLIRNAGINNIVITEHFEELKTFLGYHL